MTITISIIFLTFDNRSRIIKQRRYAVQVVMAVVIVAVGDGIDSAAVDIGHYQHFVDIVAVDEIPHIRFRLCAGIIIGLQQHPLVVPSASLGTGSIIPHRCSGNRINFLNPPVQNIIFLLSKERLPQKGA